MKRRLAFAFIFSVPTFCQQKYVGVKTFQDGIKLGPTSATFQHYDTGSFLATSVEGALTFTSQEINYTRVGNVVSLRMPALSGVSKKVKSIRTAPGVIPQELRPRSERYFPIMVRKSGTSHSAVVVVKPDGEIEWCSDVAARSWASGQAIEILETNITYDLS